MRSEILFRFRIGFKIHDSYEIHGVIDGYVLGFSSACTAAVAFCAIGTVMYWQRLRFWAIATVATQFRSGYVILYGTRNGSRSGLNKDTLESVSPGDSKMPITL